MQEPASIPVLENTGCKGLGDAGGTCSRREHAAGGSRQEDSGGAAPLAVTPMRIWQQRSQQQLHGLNSAPGIRKCLHSLPALLSLFFAPRPPEEVKNKFLSKTNPEKALSGSEAQRCQVMGREGKIPMGSRAQLGWGLCSIRTKAGSYCFPQHPHAM